MKYYKVNEIDFTKDTLNTSFVVRTVAGYESTEEIKVTKVRLKDDYLEYQTDVYNEEDQRRPAGWDRTVSDRDEFVNARPWLHL